MQDTANNYTAIRNINFWFVTLMYTLAFFSAVPGMN